jgi:hypothetical protein
LCHRRTRDTGEGQNGNRGDSGNFFH